MNHQSIDLLSERSLEQVAGGGRAIIDCEGYAYLTQTLLPPAQSQTKTVLSSLAGAGCNPDKH